MGRKDEIETGTQTTPAKEKPGRRPFLVSQQPTKKETPTSKFKKKLGTERGESRP